MAATPEPDGLGGRLHVVATPIGNLGDLSSRAAEVLAGVDLVLAEDTRRTGRLLQHLGVKVPMRSLHDHNEADRVASVVEELAAGAAVALVSDAGTPVVSDPGHRLVMACVEAGIPVVPVPGPSAVLAALVGSGLASARFTFEGFLPRKGRARRERLQELATEPRTMVLFLSPHRAYADLADLAEALGAQRQAALARELTKLHEEFVHGPLEQLADLAADGLRGELTLVVAGAPAPETGEIDPESLARLVAERQAGGAPRKSAIADVARNAGVPKKVVYQAVLDADSISGITTT